MIRFYLFIWFHDIVFYIVFPVFVVIMVWSRIRSNRANNNEPQGILPVTISNAFSALREKFNRIAATPSQPSIVNGYVLSRGGTLRDNIKE